MNSQNSPGDRSEPDVIDRDKLQFVIDRWPLLTPETRNAIYVLAEGTLPRSTHAEVIALTETLPPTG